MRNFCLIKSKVLSFKQALKDGKISVEGLINMTSQERVKAITEYVGSDQATKVIAEFESKLLLKNQELGMINWIKSVTGMTPNVRRDLIQTVRRLDKVLSPADEKSFYETLASVRLGVSVNEGEMRDLSRLSNAITESEAKWQAKLDANPTWSTDNSSKVRKQWMKDTDRLKYGLDVVNMKNYVDDLKLKAAKLKFRENPIKKIMSIPLGVPGFTKSLVASMDDSFFGRQGIKVLLDPRKSGIWAKAFVNSFKHIGKQVVAKGKWYKAGDDAVLNMVKADIMSRPNALNGKYAAGGYGLRVLSEEAYPSSVPEKIPLLGRLFKASEVAYNIGALEMRANLADVFIAKADKQGINTKNKDEAKFTGSVISAMTGRGDIGKAEVLAKELNTFAFSVKFVASNLQTLAAPAIYASKKLGISKFENKGEQFARREAATNTLSVIGTIAALITMAGLLDPESIELDPRSTNFGKIKIMGRWVDISGGMASYVVLASRLVPTVHNGKLSFWYKSSNGKYTDLLEGKYGQQTAMDVFDSFIQGKLSPVMGIIRDVWSGQNYNGEVPTPTNIAAGQIPISIQNAMDYSKDPNVAFPLGLWILDALGFSVGSTPTPNKDSGYIKENQEMSNKNFIDAAVLYAQAFGTDPETAFNRIFTGQEIRRIDNGTIIVTRMPLKDSQAIKKESNADNPTMKLDHTIPLQLGGSNDKSNLKVVTTSKWKSYTTVENYLGKLLRAGKISKKDAQAAIVDFKNGDISKDDIYEQYK